jgi:cobalt-zinc-cadmium resistance protein CzcA
MLAALIRYCIERRIAAVAVTLVVAAFGVRAYLGTAIEAYPDVTNVQVTVITQLPGLAPQEIERQVTIPIERTLNGTPEMISLRSESLFGLSLVTLTFDDDADVFEARTRVAQRVGTADLPDGVQPELAPNATPLGEVYQYRLVSPRHDLTELRSWQEWTVARVLRQVPGVADVVSFGAFLEEIHVEVDPARLQAHDLTLSEVGEAIARSNTNVGGGFLVHGDQQLTIRGVGLMANAQDVKDVVLRSDAGTPITVGDVARLVRSHAPRMGTVGFGSDLECVEGFVLLRRGENPSRVLDGVHAKVEELNARMLPDGMRIEPFYDRSTLVDATLSTVHRNLLEGFLLIVAVVWLFLRSIRGSLIVATIIPLSLLTAFIGLEALGVPANLISMGAIDFGILVDAAVVLVENVVHHARVVRPRTAGGMRAVVRHAAAEVGRPTLYAMAIIVAALLPIFTLERVEGRIFKPLALTYTLALVGALVFSFTVVPALCALLLRPKDAVAADPRFVDRLRRAYGRLLVHLLRRRGLSLLLAGGLLVAAATTVSRLGSEFLPTLDEGDIVVFVEMPPSISLAEGQLILREVRERLEAFPEVVQTLSEHGRPEDGTDNEGVNMSETFVHLRPAEQWRTGWDKERLVEAMRASVSEIPGVRFNFSQPIKDNVEESVSGVRGAVVLKVFGDDLDVIRTTLESAKAALQEVPGVVDLGLYRDTTAPQLEILLDRSALARAGIAVEDAQAVIETALRGRVATEIWKGGRIVPVRVRLPQDARRDREEIGEILLPTPSGARVPLRNVAQLELVSARGSVNREANSRFGALKFNVEGRDMGSAIAEARSAVDAAVEVPEGHYLVWSGEFENQQRALERLRVVVPVSVLIVLALLYGALQSGRGAMAILLVVPVALTGGVFALALGGVVLSVSAAVGFIALLGQVSLAGLLVVSAIEQRRRCSVPFGGAILLGARSRMRAVLMTAVLAMLGLLPMALGTGVGSETQRPFALVVVGGMATTLVTALFVLPIVYAFVASRVRRPEEADDDDEGVGQVHA